MQKRKNENGVLCLLVSNVRVMTATLDGTFRPFWKIGGLQPYDIIKMIEQL